jgi:hypothetical protein
MGSLCLGVLARAEAPAEVPQVSLLKRIEADDLSITSFLASREAAEFPDYRVYLGVDYGTELGSLARLTSRAFYGTGTYDGFDPNGPALPEEVRTSDAGPGQWVGADWKVESHAFSGHALSAGVEYRQELGPEALDFTTLLGRQDVSLAGQPDRKVGLVTNDKVALADNLSLNVRVRYDEASNATASVIAPRAEMIYRPAETSTLSAVFDQAPSASTQAESSRNYELGYRRSLWQRNTLKLSAYRRITDANAQIDTSGFEVGMERNGFRGTRTRVSYGWQANADGLAGTANSSLAQHLAKMSMEVPILPKRLSTSFELQYVGLTGPLIGDSERQHVIGNLTLASGTVSRDTRVTFGMRNLFGAKPAGSGGPVTSFVPADGRSVRLDVERKL